MPKKIRGGSLSGRRIVVTGASSGMGRAIAERFNAEGAKLALTDVNAKGLRPVARRCGAFSMAADIASLEQVEGLIGEAAEALKGIDGVVNAAGIYENIAFENITLDRWARVMAVDLTGPYMVCRAALPHLRRAKQASIVNIASTAFLAPAAGMAHYAAAKGGLIGLTRALAIELAPKVRVNAICPGQTRTALVLARHPDVKALEAAAERRVPAGRIGEPEDMASATLFLSSGESSFITGTVVTVAGGVNLY